MGGIGGPELILVFIVVLLVFGPRKIPEIARAMGKGMREFRRLSTEFQREINIADALEGKKDTLPGGARAGASGVDWSRPPSSGPPPEGDPPAAAPRKTDDPAAGSSEMKE